MLVQARQEHLAQHVARSATTPASTASSTASHRSAPSKCRLTTPHHPSSTPSQTAGRTPLSHGRPAVNDDTALAPGSTASNHSTAHKAAAVTGRAVATSSIDFFGGGDKENTLQSGKLQNTSIIGSVKGRAVLSPLTNMALSKLCRGLALDGVDSTPGMTPHALQLCPGAVPFWGPAPHCYSHSHAASSDEQRTENNATTAVAAFTMVAEESEATAEVQCELTAKTLVAAREVTANKQGRSDLGVSLPLSETAKASPLATAARQAATAECSEPSPCTSGVPSVAGLVSSDNRANSRRTTSTSPANTSGPPRSGAPGRAAARPGRRAPASSAAVPVVNRRVTRSQKAAPKNAEGRQTRGQLAAQQHITRMQTRSRTAQSARR